MLHLHGRIGRIRLGRAVGALCAALSLVTLIAASAAFAADTVRPVVDVATLTPTGVTVRPPDPGDQAIRVFWNPTPFVANPLATYKVLVNGRAGGFRHQATLDTEAMFQQLGAENGFDVQP